MALPFRLRGTVRRWLLALYVGGAAVATLQHATPARANNFAIFRAAFFNLLAGRDLYVLHPHQHADLYKYSPTFALLFAPFAVPPFALALFGWNLLNALLVYYALARLLPGRQAETAIALSFLPILGPIQNAQSNALLGALMVLVFLALERGRQLGATLAIVVGACVKIFPLAAVPLGILYPRRWRLALLLAAVGLAALLLPLLVAPPAELLAQYRSWRQLTAQENREVYGTSVMMLLHLYLGLDWPRWVVQLAGTALLLLPLLVRRERWGDADFRRLFLCSVLVYVVIFNHKAERPTYVIAFLGVVIWFVSSPPSRLRTALMAFTFLVVAVLFSDLVPGWLKRDVLNPYAVKAVPCFLAWLAMQAELLGAGRGPALRSAAAEESRSAAAPAMPTNRATGGQ